ncbi:MAG: ATP synthase F0 subunit C [Fimbriiglobus sp.]
MRKVLALLAVLVLLASPMAALAVDEKAAPAGAAAPVAAATAAPVKPLNLGPLGMGLSVVGVGVGLGMIGFAAMGGIARQPEQAGNIRTAMLIIGGLVEGAGIIGLVLCFVAGLI